ncbi:2-oxo-4-hydroxy-4-carboxy-5-ureidoimidazoline decarboxylase [Pseudoxanthobacter sp.]|uniref:2-oxo-4-hydroxy-4-carboxy-5-ureidoimidazoline decarboxylase n=1 Tax=Pseudoxanthobacter sp. TaxID=1925742 RepID=UPI002FE10508
MRDDTPEPPLSGAPGPAPVPVTAVNALSPAEFVARFGDVAEHSPWVAEQAAARRPFTCRDHMIAAFTQAVAEAPEEAQLALIRAHPDLAGRAAMAGGLTADSAREQGGAGLGALTPEEFARFTDLNTRYLATFGFPFILAVKGATKQAILASFAERIHNTPKTEFATAMLQIARIIRFRLEDRVGTP